MFDMKLIILHVVVQTPASKSSTSHDVLNSLDTEYPSGYTWSKQPQDGASRATSYSVYPGSHTTPDDAGEYYQQPVVAAKFNQDVDHPRNYQTSASNNQRNSKSSWQIQNYQEDTHYDSAIAAKPSQPLRSHTGKGKAEERDKFSSSYSPVHDATFTADNQVAYAADSYEQDNTSRQPQQDTQYYGQATKPKTSSHSRSYRSGKGKERAATSSDYPSGQEETSRGSYSNDTPSYNEYEGSSSLNNVMAGMNLASHTSLDGEGSHQDQDYTNNNQPTMPVCPSSACQFHLRQPVDDSP